MMEAGATALIAQARATTEEAAPAKAAAAATAAAVSPLQVVQAAAAVAAATAAPLRERRVAGRLSWVMHREEVVVRPLLRGAAGARVVRVRAARAAALQREGAGAP